MTINSAIVSVNIERTDVPSLKNEGPFEISKIEKQMCKSVFLGGVCKPHGHNFWPIFDPHPLHLYGQFH